MEISAEYSTPQTAHELAHLSCIAHAFKTYADELLPIAQALKSYADELLPIAQALKTCADLVAPIDYTSSSSRAK